MGDKGTQDSIREMAEVMFLTPEQRLPKPYYEDEFCTLFCGDALEVVPKLGNFDLLLIDPPYGIGENQRKNLSRSKPSPRWRNARARDYGEFTWDDAPVSQELINFLLSSSTEQMIFGGNYYELPPTSCWLVWDKLNGATDFADCELAWTNLKQAVRIIRHCWNGFQRPGNEPRWHPTQKPLPVMSWLLTWSKTQGTVVDCFAGSGTTLVAAKMIGRKSIGVELESRYCAIAAERLRNTTPSLFVAPPPKQVQESFFTGDK